MKPVKSLLLIGCAAALFCGAALAQAPAGAPPAGAPSPQELMMPDMFFAAAMNNSDAVKALIAKGANPNCRNFLSFTPLMLAAATGHEEVATTLLASGADLNARSPYGTPLTFAAMLGQRAMAQFLISRGADPGSPRPDRINLLMLAAGNGDTTLMNQALRNRSLLTARDADGATSLMFATRAGQVEAARLLLSRGAPVDAMDSHRWTALMYAAAAGQPAVAQLLLSKGANPNTRDTKGQTPLMLAASYSGDPATLRALLGAKGADLQAKDARGRTALDILQWRRNTSMVALLKARGATESARLQPVSQKTAIQRGLGMIQFSTATFQKKVQCMSCHHQGLGLMVTGLARERGFPIDRKLEGEQEARALHDFEEASPMLQQILHAPEMAKLIPSAEIGDLTPGAGYVLAGVAAHGKPADPAIAATAVILGRLQFPDGHWQFGMPRVPIQSSYFTMTALAIRGVQAYAPKEYAGEMAERLRKAQSWVLSAPTQTSEDRASRLLALKWLGAPPADRAKATAELLADQKSDGGWAQLPTLRSDAYATGLALYALNQGGEVPVSDAAYRRGVSFLLRTQDEDGSWYVNKRAVPANNYTDAGFPHGESQYASYGATAWATMALILAERPGGAAQVRR